MSTPTIYYKDEHVLLWHGDALAVMADLRDQTIGAVLTDPPYSSGGRRENVRTLRKSLTRSVPDDEWIRGDAMSTQGFTWFMRMCALQWRRLLAPGGHVLCFTDWRMAPVLSAALETADLRQHPTIVWDKTHFGMGAIFRNQYELVIHMTAGTARAPRRRDVGNVIACPPVRSEVHPNEKPLPLIAKLLSVIGEAPILDPCAGSGTTLLAARQLGLTSIGVEADERHCEVIARRLSQGILDFNEVAS